MNSAQDHPSVKRHAANVEAARQWLSQFPKAGFDDGRKTRAEILWNEFEEDTGKSTTYEQFVEGAVAAGFRLREQGEDHYVNIVDQRQRENIIFGIEC